MGVRRGSVSSHVAPYFGLRDIPYHKLTCHPEPVKLMGVSEEKFEGSCGVATFDISMVGKT